MGDSPQCYIVRCPACGTPQAHYVPVAGSISKGRCKHCEEEMDAAKFILYLEYGTLAVWHEEAV